MQEFGYCTPYIAKIALALNWHKLVHDDESKQNTSMIIPPVVTR
jgi:hypothetical protein